MHDASEIAPAGAGHFASSPCMAAGVGPAYFDALGTDPEQARDVEPELRPMLKELHNAGVTIALPVVETRAAPPVFRRWTPDTKMVRGHRTMPVPAPEADPLIPDITLAPCLGWSEGWYRLGCGEGYFDRTPAVLAPRPLAIGIAPGAARLPTIYPQPHDIPLDLIVTEHGLSAERRTTP